MLTDKVISCKDCGKEFVFSVSEQKFYEEKGFTNEPARCPECRAAKKAQGRGNRGGQRGGNRGRSFAGRPERKMYTATCTSCGKPATVPFQPTGEKPVLCKDCYQPKSKTRW